MIKEVIKSIKSDFDRAIFYWIVLTLSSMFMFMFFHLSLSEVIGVTFINSKNDISTNLTVFVIIVCMIVIFMANDFYVRKKSKELATILVCGGSYLQLVEFLLMQTGIILLLSIPVGVLIGYICFPLLELLLVAISSRNVNIELSYQAILSTVIVMGFEIFWCTLLNLGYSYRNSIRTLMHGEEKIKIGKLPKFFDIKVIKSLYIFLYIGCIVGMYFIKENMNAIFLLGFLGLIGMGGCINKIVIPYIDQSIRSKWIGDSEKIVYMGFFRNDLKIMKKNIYVLICTSILLLALMAMAIDNSIETALCLLSYVVMCFLLSLSFMFRFSTEIVSRKNYFQSLSKIGYLFIQQKLIIIKELVLLYGFILVVSMFYILNIMIVLYMHNYIILSVALLVMIVFAVPLIICGLINYIYYKKVIILG